MHSLDETFKELLAKVRDPNSLNPAKSDPIFYFAYPPEMMLDVKKRLPLWEAKLKDAGFSVTRISMADLIWELVEASGRYEAWLELESDAEPGMLNEAVRDVLRQGGALTQRISTVVESAQENAIILITETELLHPYFRTRTIESQLHDKVHTPTVIFYPGRRSGTYGLHFLNFYSVDGNYRSTLVGGL